MFVGGRSSDTVPSFHYLLFLSPQLLPWCYQQYNFTARWSTLGFYHCFVIGSACILLCCEVYSYAIEKQEACLTVAGNFWQAKFCGEKCTYSFVLYTPRLHLMQATTSQWQLYYTQWYLIIVGLLYGTFFMSSLWYIEFSCGWRIFGKFSALNDCHMVWCRKVIYTRDC
jgi:hypothetical protein